jgi:hypothetical protein
MSFTKRLRALKVAKWNNLSTDIDCISWLNTANLVMKNYDFLQKFVKIGAWKEDFWPSENANYAPAGGKIFYIFEKISLEKLELT